MIKAVRLILVLAAALALVTVTAHAQLPDYCQAGVGC